MELISEISADGVRPTLTFCNALEAFMTAVFSAVHPASMKVAAMASADAALRCGEEGRPRGLLLVKSMQIPSQVVCVEPKVNTSLEKVVISGF